jgi:hypothetical protein
MDGRYASGWKASALQAFSQPRPPEWGEHMTKVPLFTFLTNNITLKCDIYFLESNLIISILKIF